MRTASKLLLTLLFVCAACRLLSQQKPICPAAASAPPVPAADLVSYLKDISGIDQQKRLQAIAKLRDHAWYLFASVTAQDAGCGKPVWRTWVDKPTALHIREQLNSKASVHLESDREYHVALDLNFSTRQLDSDPGATLEAVNFNPQANGHLQTQSLFDPKLSARLTRDGAREVPEFPTGSVVVKTFWRIVHPGVSLRMGLWDWKYQPVDSIAPEDRWSSHVCVYVSKPDNLCNDTQVSADQFYFTDVQNPDEFACFECTVTVNKGDRLILIGMHISTKEIPDWDWATFWWHGIAESGCPKCDAADAQRPARLKGVWRNYSMETTVSTKFGSVGRAIFNPYIEGTSFGVNTNCIQCHDQAAVSFHLKPAYDVTLFDLEGFLQTDFLWSVANRLKQ